MATQQQSQATKKKDMASGKNWKTAPYDVF